ncbi:MAG: hypothetical protein ACLFTK_00120 [Anaerolineales bacterium]
MHRDKQFVCFACRKTWRKARRKTVQTRVCPHCGGMLQAVSGPVRWSSPEVHLPDMSRSTTLF